MREDEFISRTFRHALCYEIFSETANTHGKRRLHEVGQIRVVVIQNFVDDLHYLEL